MLFFFIQAVANVTNIVGITKLSYTTYSLLEDASLWELVNFINKQTKMFIPLTRFCPVLAGKSPVSIQNNSLLVHCKPLAFLNLD